MLQSVVKWKYTEFAVIEFCVIFEDINETEKICYIANNRAQYTSKQNILLYLISFLIFSLATWTTYQLKTLFLLPTSNSPFKILLLRGSLRSFLS